MSKVRKICTELRATCLSMYIKSMSVSNHASSSSSNFLLPSCEELVT